MVLDLKNKICVGGARACILTYTCIEDELDQSSVELIANYRQR